MTWGSNQPTGLVQSASVSVGSGASATLVGPSDNGVRLLSLTISSGACAGAAPPPVGFLVEDVVNDTNGVQYLACEMGIPNGVNINGFNTASIDEAGIVVPAGVTLQVVNGGAGGTGALRRCSASLTYVIL